MLKSARERAQLLGLPFNITIEDIVIPEHCPLLGVKLHFGTLTDRVCSPSLDRIIPELGYVKGNVWVISFRANAIKQDATVEELEMLAANLKLRCQAFPILG